MCVSSVYRWMDVGKSVYVYMYYALYACMNVCMDMYGWMYVRTHHLRTYACLDVWMDG
jgi:hypothetical protein